MAGEDVLVQQQFVPYGAGLGQEAALVFLHIVLGVVEDVLVQQQIILDGARLEQ